jgi:flagellar basal body-associated protein FliL
MADNILGDTFSPVGESLSSGMNIFSGGGLYVIIGLFIGITLVAIAGAFAYFFWYEKKQWRIITRVHYENPQINGLSFGSGVPTKRVRFKDGRVVYMYKTPIQGYIISPELLTWTRPLEHDVLVTQDKKLFCLTGINSIDIQRKKLNVDISYPDIEYDRQDLQHHVDSKKFDDPNDRLKIIAKAALWIFVFVTVIVLAVLASKYLTDVKEIELERDRINFEISKNSNEVMEQVNTFLTILEKTIPELNKNKNIV